MIAARIAGRVWCTLSLLQILHRRARLHCRAPKEQPPRESLRHPDCGEEATLESGSGSWSRSSPKVQARRVAGESLRPTTERGKAQSASC